MRIITLSYYQRFIPGVILNFLVFTIWTAVWLLGGFLLSTCAFRLTSKEHFPTAVILGITLSTLSGNWLVRVLPVELAFWLAAAIPLVLGLLGHLWQRFTYFKAIKVDWQVILMLLLNSLLFFAIGRGLSIYDDYAHLPTISLMAAGNLPPRFPLDPSIPYAYHYFLLLFSAMIQRVADAPTWTALAISRALVFSTTILLAAFFARRLTRSLAASIFTAAVFMFATGARWLLLLIPPEMVKIISGQVNLIGTGFLSGPLLSDALINPVLIEGSGPILFPFAFANGIQEPGVMATFGPNSTFWLAIILTILLSANRWRSRAAPVLTVLLVAAMNLLTEANILLISAAWLLLIVLWVRRRQAAPTFRPFLPWVLVWAAGTLVGSLQGGALTQFFSNWLQALSGHTAPSYQTISFSLAWPPALVSFHLGALTLSNPIHLLVALFEVGPLITMLPLASVWAVKAFRAGKWFETAYLAAGLGSLLLVFVQFTGSTGVRNTSRMYMFMEISLVYFAPIIWVWLHHKTSRIRIWAGALSGMALISGLILFGLQLIAIQRPVYASYIQPLDVTMMENYWDRLEGNGYVFDSIRSRAPVIFARYNYASNQWASDYPQWQVWVEQPDPSVLAVSGFDYAYMDNDYWYGLNEIIRSKYKDGCPLLVEQVTNARNEFRRLYDLRPCK